MINFATLDLNLLRILDALLIEGSTTRAGQRVGLSQPAISAALGRLRHALNDDLFLRRGNRLDPTEYARQIEEPLRLALEQLESALTGPLQFDPTVATDTFKLSGSDFFAEMLMPRLADTVYRRAPYMRVQLVDLVPDSYVDTLERYSVDAALIPDTDVPDWIEKRPLFLSGWAVVARTGNRRLASLGLQPGDTIPIDTFCDMGHVLFSPEGNLRAMGDAALSKVGRERRVVMTMPVFSGVYRAVSESELIAILPIQLAQTVAPYAGLTVYKAPIEIPTVQIVMIWHRRYSSSPAHVWVRDLIAELLAPLDAMHW